MWESYKNSRFTVWIKIKVDPHDKFRGFSIEGRELRVQGYEPVMDEMKDLRGETMPGKFWVVSEDEVYRVIPEMKRFNSKSSVWFFPVEFCNSFIRPYYYLDTPHQDIKLLWDDD